MLALGIILILVSSGVVIAAIAGGADDPATFIVGNLDVRTSTMAVFLLGAAAVLVLVAGLELTRVGARRERKRRKDAKKLSRLTELARENEQPTEEAPTVEEPAPGQAGVATEPRAGQPAAPTTEQPITGQPTTPTTGRDTAPDTEVTTEQTRPERS